MRYFISGGYMPLLIEMDTDASKLSVISIDKGVEYYYSSGDHTYVLNNHNEISKDTYTKMRTEMLLGIAND